MTGLLQKLRRRPQWWLRFVQSHPIVPTLVTVVGLTALMFLLAPTVSTPDTQPSERGRTIDSLSGIIKSDAVINKAISFRSAYHELIPTDVRHYFAETIFNPALYLVIPFLFMLEYLFPCSPTQPLFGKGFLQDAIWFAASVPVGLLILGVADEFLSKFYGHYLSFLTISGANTWPRWVQVLGAISVTEFAVYVSHAVRHKVPPLWFFHSVHHSLTEMNTFAGDRVHFVDRFVETLFRFIPFYMFQAPSLYAVAIFGVYVTIHSRFVHTNTKIDLGWLGWLIVSPQFHRVHHSTEQAHWDRNFSGVFSLFDYMCGTAHPARDVYPETGVDYPEFPHECKTSVLHLPENWVRQNIFPFALCLKSIRMALSKMGGLARPGEPGHKANRQVPASIRPRPRLL